MKGLIFTYALCFGGSLVALFRPFVGLLVYVAFAILRPGDLWNVQRGGLSQVVAIGMLLGWAGHGFGSWRFGRGRAVLGLLVGYLVWMAATCAFAIDPASAWGIVDTSSKIVLPCLVGATVIDSIAKLRTLAWTILVCEGYVAYEFNLSYFAGFNRLWLQGFGSLDNNGNAVALVSCAGIGIVLMLYAGNWLAKAVAAGFTLLMAHAILFSFSRGGMLAMGITGFATFLLIPKRPAHYALFTVGVLIMLRLAGPQVIDRFMLTFGDETGVEASAESRLDQWAAVLVSLQSRPLGVGPAQWRLLSEQFGLPDGQAVHSTWFQVAAEMGLPGVALLLLFYLVGIRRLWPLTRESTPVPDPWFRYLARMVIASLIGFMIAAQFVTLHLLEIPYYVNLIGICLLKLWSTQETPTIPDWGAGAVAWVRDPATAFQGSAPGVPPGGYHGSW